ncbi:MAG: anthranilate phosphoribosyltransferase [Thermodesulfobacteriota bacterium]
MIHEAIAKAALRLDLREEEMIQVMEQVSDGRATPAQIGALMVGLSMKGECAAEIIGAAKVLRSRCLPVPVGAGARPLVDTCGTGGDGMGTFNVSTTAALVAAGCGLRVAKHGNRSVSSRSGSADVLEALGVNIELTPEAVGECLERLGIGFLFAPRLHPAMRHAVLPRREVGLKSIFNLVGPLTNPAGAEFQVVGVFRPDAVETMARALAGLGCVGAFVVHGLDGCDEISITGPTQVVRLHQGRITVGRITPEEAGLSRASPGEVRGGDASENAAITLAVLEGEKGPRRDMVLLNAAAALVAAGKVADFRDGVGRAARSIDSGAARAKLADLVELTGRLAPSRRAVAG